MGRITLVAEEIKAVETGVVLSAGTVPEEDIPSKNAA